MNIKTLYAYDDIKRDDCVISEWRVEIDLDDYIEISFGKLHYNLINELLILLNKNKSNYINIISIIESNNTRLTDFLNLCTKIPKGVKECLVIHLNNILILSKAIKDSITYYDYIESVIVPDVGDLEPLIEIQNDQNNLYLYRGFNNISSSSKIFEVINKDSDIITTPIFLSTTVIKTVAKRFLDRRAHEPVENKIMWKIVVPSDKLKIFNYIYFGQDINIDEYDDKIKKQERICGEFEFLLNIGAILKLKNKEIINDDYNDPITTNPRTQISYTLYTYEFQGWDNETVGTNIYNLKHMINDLIENFTTSSISPKPRKTKQLKSYSSTSPTSPTSAKRSKK